MKHHAIIKGRIFVQDCACVGKKFFGGNHFRCVVEEVFDKDGKRVSITSSDMTNKPYCIGCGTPFKIGGFDTHGFSSSASEDLKKTLQELGCA